MTTVQMRILISDVYHMPNWREKVAQMSDGQVVAIYYRFLKENKFVTEKPVTIKEPEVQIHQMTLYECGLKKGD